jgi:hypothetical protein
MAHRADFRMHLFGGTARLKRIAAPATDFDNMILRMYIFLHFGYLRAYLATSKTHYYIDRCSFCNRIFRKSALTSQIPVIQRKTPIAEPLQADLPYLLSGFSHLISG